MFVSVSVTTQKVQIGVIPLRKQVDILLTSFCIRVWSYSKTRGLTPGPQNVSLYTGIHAQWVWDLAFN